MPVTLRAVEAVKLWEHIVHPRGTGPHPSWLKPFVARLMSVRQAKQDGTLLALNMPANSPSGCRRELPLASDPLRTEGMVAAGQRVDELKDPPVFVDAALAILKKDPRQFSGQALDRDMLANPISSRDLRGPLTSTPPGPTSCAGWRVCRRALGPATGLDLCVASEDTAAIRAT